MTSLTVCILLLAATGTLGFVATVPKTANGLAELDLGGTTWSLANANGTWRVDDACHVPGDVYTDLLRNGLITEPFYRFGDVEYRWIAHDNWTYFRNFLIPPNISIHLTGNFSANRVVLELDGLQVVADIFLNGILVGSTFDQFLQYRFDVTDIVNKFAADGTFNITVAFTSSVFYGEQQSKSYALWPSPWAPPIAPDELPYRNFVRAEQSSFGWDWGPAFAPQGIYRPLRLLFDLGSNGTVEPAAGVSARIVHIVPHVFPVPYNQTVDRPLTDGNNSFWLPMEVYVAASVNPVANVSMVSVIVAVTTSPSLHNVSNQTTLHLSPGDDYPYASLDLYVSNVALWWPNGYGNPTLHDLTISVFDASTGSLLDSKTIRTGIRSAELITYGDPLSFTSSAHHSTLDAGQDDIVSDRPVMFFRINGIPIFAQGANLVPFDAFQGRVNDTVMENVLEAAVAAHMNMVRVWGGGIFPLDSFYRMADEKGIMLWQEMIFACSEYPIDAEFLQKVRSEISYQLRRLSYHPSIVVWSGNNENGIYDWGPGSPYEVLDYSNVLHQIIREDTSRPIWPSSPSTGFAYGVTPSGLPAGTRTSPLPFKVGGKSGDTHWYNYFDCPNVNLYPQTNFGSEFGFQSLPWFDNIAPMCEPEDWSLFSTFMNHRQHHPLGNVEMALLLAQNFQVPNLTSTQLSVFKRVIYLSQLQQVLCIADEASFYKRGRNMPYRTMGSLYWQLNHNWQAPSWTSLEYGGEWKVLHYAMRTVYGPLHLSSFYNATNDMIVAHLASNLLEAVTGAVVVIEAVPLAAGSAVARHLVAEVLVPTIPALSGVFFWSITKNTLMKNLTTLCSSDTSCFLLLSLKNSVDGSLLCPPQPQWLNTVKNIALDNSARVVCNVTSAKRQTATLSLTVPDGSGPALFVFVRNTKYRGTFSENILFLIPRDKPREVVFTAKKLMNYGQEQEIASVEDFANSLTIEYLNQMWN